jgi:hypothetical protein
MGNVRITNTPYDDVFRTLLNDCSPPNHPCDKRGVRGIIRDRKKSSSPQTSTF